MSQILTTESPKYIFHLHTVKGSGSHLQSKNVRLDEKNNSM